MAGRECETSEGIDKRKVVHNLRSTKVSSNKCQMLKFGHSLKLPYIQVIKFQRVFIDDDSSSLNPG